MEAGVMKWDRGRCWRAKEERAGLDAKMTHTPHQNTNASNLQDLLVWFLLSWKTPKERGNWTDSSLPVVTSAEGPGLQC